MLKHQASNAHPIHIVLHDPALEPMEQTYVHDRSCTFSLRPVSPLNIGNQPWFEPTSICLARGARSHCQASDILRRHHELELIARPLESKGRLVQNR